MTHRFRIGDRVRVRADEVAGHHRTPAYLKGKTGVIERTFGAWCNPETLAYGKPGLPKRALYTVRFEMDEVWQGDGGYSAADTVTADLYAHWLESADAALRK